MTGPAAPGIDADKALTIVAGVVAAACLLVWAATQVTVRFASGEWHDTPLVEAPRLALHVILYPDQPAAHDVVEPTVFYATLAVLAVVTCAVCAVVWRAVRDRARNDDGDDARWAKPRDLKPLLVRRPQPGRLTLGTVERRLIATEQQHSVCIIGPTGTGKTTGFAIPAISEWDGPVVATTIKGDLLQPTMERRSHQGNVWVYDPTAVTGRPATGWSPLDACHDWQGALRMGAWLVSTARAGDRGGLQDADFWYAVAQKLLAPLLYGAAVSGKTMRDVVRWVDLQDETEPLQALFTTGEADPIQAFNATENREERTRSSAYTTAETVLAAFADPGVLDATTNPTRITPAQLLDGGNHTLYVCGPLDEQARLRPLYTALIEEMISAIYRRAARPDTMLTKPLLLVLDEAANIAPLPDLAQLAATARGVGIQLVTVWQDFAQIQARYGTFAPTVINNHRAKVVLSGVSDPPTLDYVTRLIGDERVTETSIAREGGGSVRSTTESTRQRPLASIGALRQAPIGTGVLVYGNLHPARIKLRRPRQRIPRHTDTARQPDLFTNQI